MRASVRTKTTNEPQLELFTVNALKCPIYETTHSIRPNGGEALAGVPAEDGRRTRSEEPTSRVAARSGGANRNGTRPDSPEADSAGSNAATGARPSLGNGAGEIHLPAARVVADSHQQDTEEECEPDAAIAEPEPLRNQNNFRITHEDRIGIGTLKQKCRDNLAAIELLKQLESESRLATEDEKRVLVRYVGWGGLPRCSIRGMSSGKKNVSTWNVATDTRTVIVSPPLRISSLENNHQLVVWDSAPGVNYQVLATTNLLQPFQAISPIIQGAGAATFFYDNSPPANQKFYEVMSLP